jgi:hypothetical protein
MTKLIILILSLLAVVIFTAAFFLSERDSYAKPTDASDSDGTRDSDILTNVNSSFEKVILKVSPFGYLEVSNWEGFGLVKKATAIVNWRTYKDFGAGNIYVGYSFGDIFTEVGPFNESAELTETKIEIPVNPFTDLRRLRVRFRGEDTDFGPDAVAEVNIRLRVTYYGF